MLVQLAEHRYFRVGGCGLIPSRINTEEKLPLLCKWLDPRRGSDDHVNCGPVSAKDVKP
jgi:hypothetical protein